jgi:hypothetical protein
MSNGTNNETQRRLRQLANNATALADLFTPKEGHPLDEAAITKHRDFLERDIALVTEALPANDL